MAKESRELSVAIAEKEKRLVLGLFCCRVDVWKNLFYGLCTVL